MYLSLSLFLSKNANTLLHLSTEKPRQSIIFFIFMSIPCAQYVWSYVRHYWKGYDDFSYDSYNTFLQGDAGKPGLPGLQGLRVSNFFSVLPSLLEAKTTIIKNTCAEISLANCGNEAWFVSPEARVLFNYSVKLESTYNYDSKTKRRGQNWNSYLRETKISGRVFWQLGGVGGAVGETQEHHWK